MPAYTAAAGTGLLNRNIPLCSQIIGMQKMKVKPFTAAAADLGLPDV